MGEDALERVLDHEPEKLLAVKGIKEKKLEKILATWHRFKDLKAFLSQFLIPLAARLPSVSVSTGSWMRRTSSPRSRKTPTG